MKAPRSCPLFAGMSEIEIDPTSGNISYQPVSLPSHEVYALTGMPCKYVDIVASGKFICRMAALSGKQVEVSRLHSGNMVAPAFIFSKDRSLPISVETDDRVQLLRIRPGELKRLIDLDGMLRMNYIRILSNIDAFLTQKMKVLGLFTVHEGVACPLMERAGEQGSNEVHLECSCQEIADSFGTQKFPLLRVLSDSEKEGTVETHGRTTKILDRRKVLK